MAIIDLLSQYTWALVSSAFLFWLLIGSFINVVAYRLPKMMDTQWRHDCCQLLEIPAIQEAPPAITFNLATPRSRCPACNHLIRAWENIPVVSYLALGGKCSQCKQPIPPRYPYVEFISGVLCAIVALRFGFTVQTLLAIALTGSLLSLTLIDLDHQLLPDDITLPLVWLGLIVNYFGSFTSFELAFWGAIAGYLCLWSVFWIFKLITGKDGMGFGDFKLLAALGAWCGWPMLPLIILLSSLCGIAGGGITLYRQRQGRETPFAFGPYLAAAGWIALLWGKPIMSMYLHIAGIQ